MKKTFSTVIFTAIVLALLSVTVFAGYVMGDINNDGDVTPADARLALRYAINLDTFTQEQIAAADVDKSGDVTTSDARMILRVAAGLEIFVSPDEVNDLLIEPGVLNVAVCANNPPFCYTEKGQIKGVDVDVAKKLAASYGLELKLHNMSKDKLETSIKDKKCDIIISNYAKEDDYYSQGLIANTYIENAQYIFRLNNKSIKIDDLKSKNIGVIKGSVADSMLIKDVSSGKLGDAKIMRYTRYSDAATALKNNEIFAVIGADDLYKGGMSNVGTYRFDNLLVLADKENQNLLQKIATRMSNGIIQSMIFEYCPPIKSDSKAIAEKTKLTLAPGAVSITELKVDSFYRNDEELIIDTSDFNADIRTHEGKFYLVIIAPETEKSGKIKINYLYEDVNALTIDVTVKKSGSTKYNFGKESYCPDFGAYSGVAPYDVILDFENDAITYVYDAERLYNAGMTETEHYEKYLSLMKKHGFVYESYTTDNASYYMELYVNNSIEQVAAYTEQYYTYGEYLYLNAVGLTVSHKF